MKTSFELVREFHEAFDSPAPTNFVRPDQDTLLLRSELIMEELDELDAEMKKLEDGRDYSKENIAKEICDLVYVVLGLAVTLGIPFDACFDEVHRSNMSKLGEDGRPIHREDGKVLKGANFSPADLSSIMDFDK